MTCRPCRFRNRGFLRCRQGLQCCERKALFHRESRDVTRSLAIAPAVAFTVFWGDEKVMELMILSQVVLSPQRAFAVIPLVKFTSSSQKMGPFANRWLPGRGRFC